MKKVTTSTNLKALNWGTGKDAANGSTFGVRWFGKAPWHRKDSEVTVGSVSSSVRQVLAGRTPPASPQPEAFLNRGPFDYELTPYPAGEATRVKTPPLHENTADGKPRGFFGDLMPPGEEIDDWDPAHLTRPETEKYGGICEKNFPKKPKEWWDAKQRVQLKKVVPSPQPFEFDIPEHLPSSPMCPSNPKHSSGGKGLCVYHGRRRESSGLKVEQVMRERRQGSEVSITSQGDEF
ncbi:hypothetical protein CkaCkLH20_00986 [Colletotrichum karsti]|uniref:Uncharacterized protein n=1 Tax=Colletotrichum karsti TaxID=1095194 RepID=A0A9P6IFL9_9PEZI|nr:uncharacterized protein CkaCkLH20_00986 [Colletotrichum karsti]KAF9881840.1 hypothetical protein CkaCkLH20_00986 [Colletotrichum karsti]